MTAKEAKCKKMQRQFYGILTIITQSITSKDLSAGFIFKGAIFPEVVDKLKSLGFDILLSDDELIPKYYISFADIGLTDEEISNAFSLPSNAIS